MLNYPKSEIFFDYCLLEAGVANNLNRTVNLATVKADTVLGRELIKILRDIQTGADAVLARGKPAEDALKLSAAEWEHRWNVWAASRRAAFFSRAAMLMLGDASHFDYFIKTLRSSQNLVFLTGSSDVLQHASGVYLNGPEEDFSNADLAQWWQQRHNAGNMAFGA